MADAVTSQVLHESGSELIMKFTNISDGTGESAAPKVDVSTLTPAATAVVIEKIYANTTGMGVDILWDADTDVLAWHVSPDQFTSLEFEGRSEGLYGLTNNAGTGKTGDIKFTTTGHSSGDRYAIVLVMRKVRT